jgi:hypothetical protein
MNDGASTDLPGTDDGDVIMTPDAAQAASLLARYPAWAVWLPAAGREWTAVRVAGARPPGPGLPLLWARGATAGDLARQMEALDEQASAGGWPRPPEAAGEAGCS